VDYLTQDSRQESSFGTGKDSDMAKIYNAVQRMLTDTRGQDLLEYALIAGFVAVAAGAIFPTTLMPNVSMIFSKLGSLFIQSASQGS
jgi:Flp pilus assembly pilin Flp